MLNKYGYLLQKSFLSGKTDPQPVYSKSLILIWSIFSIRIRSNFRSMIRINILNEFDSRIGASNLQTSKSKLNSTVPELIEPVFAKIGSIISGRVFLNPEVQGLIPATTKYLYM